MELNRQTIKSLSSETRVDILKSLARRRKMTAELSKEFGMAPSTISEHLKNLENSKLIQKKETGHKWIYYELTDKGQTLVKPQYTPQFVVILVLGGLIFLAGFSTFLIPPNASPSYFGVENLVAELPMQDIINNQSVETYIDSNRIFSKSAQAIDSALDNTENFSENKNSNFSKSAQTINSTLDSIKNVSENKKYTPSISVLTLILILVGMWLMIIAFVLPKKYGIEV